jgi:hypothetical protein
MRLLYTSKVLADSSGRNYSLSVTARVCEKFNIYCASIGANINRNVSMAFWPWPGSFHIPFHHTLVFDCTLLPCHAPLTISTEGDHITRDAALLLSTYPHHTPASDTSNHCAARTPSLFSATRSTRTRAFYFVFNCTVLQVLQCEYNKEYK